MSLPSEDVLEDIRKLITAVTGFQENEENFGICERYCLSHVIHHTYPSVNRTSVKNVINGFVSRFHGHGYFKVSQELNSQVKTFLSNEKLFQKNPQYDIQWCLLALVSSLSSNLTSVKHVPELLPVDEEENETEDVNWGEYLTSDLPKVGDRLSSDSETSTEDDDNQVEHPGSEVKPSEQAKNFEVIPDYRVALHNERESELRRERIEQFLLNRQSKSDIENDSRVWGNISKRFEMVMNKEGVHRKFQYVSEYELMENILYQFQTGERILLRKGLISPALTSLTQETLADYLDSLQPYFKVMRSFRDFEIEMTVGRYPEKEFLPLNEAQPSSSRSGLTSRRRKVSSVLYVYSMMLKKAVEPFQMKLMEIVENLNSYTLIKMAKELETFFFDLTSLYRVHVSATRNWKKEANWMSSIRVLSVLYNATMEATTSKLSFVYLNLFLHCFRVYLDIIDVWISHLDLMDPHDEFIVTRLEDDTKSENRCSEYVIRSYKEEMKKSGVKEVAILDFIAEEMIHVGQSLEILRRLNRFVSTEMRSSSSFESLVERIREQTNAFGQVRSKTTGREREKQRSIFTVRNVSLVPVGEETNGGGDWVKEDKKEEKEGGGAVEIEVKVEEGTACCTEFIRSTIHNPYLKMAFEEVGMKAVEMSLKEAKEREGTRGSDLMLIEKVEEDGWAIYPFHKIISESCHRVLGSRLSDPCELVKDIVLREHDLEGRLSLLRSVLLFNDSYLIQPFVLGFYTQPIIRRNSYSLTLNLRECAEVRYKDLATALSVTVGKHTSPLNGEDVLKAIDAITVNYEVKWPLTLIFTPEVMEKYNGIFRIGLKLKWAHWTLSGLGFKDVQSDSTTAISRSRRHRLELLRFRFLSALSRINNYFMTSMIPPEVTMKGCKDLKDIIKAHSDYLERIHYNCLLGGKSPEGWKLVFQNLIPMCKELEMFWLDGNLVTEAKLSTMETDFKSSLLLLSRLMSTLMKD